MPDFHEFRDWPNYWLNFEGALTARQLYTLKWAYLACEKGGQDWQKTYEALANYFAS